MYQVREGAKSKISSLLGGWRKAVPNPKQFFKLGFLFSKMVIGNHAEMYHPPAPEFLKKFFQKYITFLSLDIRDHCCSPSLDPSSKREQHLHCEI